ncbi:MAG: hypothetical protein AAB834_02885, partial [Patescibacteria group bacterium]
TQTWGSTLYRDYAGNHWRVDHHDQRTGERTASTADDQFVSKETVFDSHNDPVKTTVRETLPDGTAQETTTYHETGKVETRTGSYPDIFPERYQPGEGGGGDTVAPRGWSNPISGVVQNPGLATGNNQVNPGRENGGQPAATPLLLDPEDLVTNPAPDEARGANPTPRDIRHEQGDVTIIDPPRPGTN